MCCAAAKVSRRTCAAFPSGSTRFTARRSSHRCGSSGEIQAVGFYAGFAEDAFLPGETDVLGECISLLSELWLSPATRGGLFLPAYVDSGASSSSSVSSA